MLAQAIEQPLDHVARQVGAGGIVDQHQRRLEFGELLQRVVDRLLARRAAGHEADLREIAQRRHRLQFRALGNGDHDRVGPGIDQRFGGMGDQRLAAIVRKLLRQRLSCARARAGGDNDGRKGRQWHGFPRHQRSAYRLAAFAAMHYGAA